MIRSTRLKHQARGNLERLRDSLPKNGKYTKAEAMLDLYLDDVLVGKRKELKDYWKRWEWPKTSSHRLLKSFPVTSLVQYPELKKKKSKNNSDLVKRSYDIPEDKINRLSRMKEETSLSFNTIIRLALDQHLKDEGF